MINYQKSYRAIEQSPLASWLEELPFLVDEKMKGSRWGDLPRWLEALKELPELKDSSIDLKSDYIRIGDANDIDGYTREYIEKVLRILKPWRKGPFNVFGIPVETEWRSDLKWNRLKDHISSLENRTVLDVGCGSGYHCWRMAGAGAKLIIGIEPTLLYVVQFFAMQKYIEQQGVTVFPLGIEEIPKDLSVFDTVFSMGLLYHRRAPVDHLMQMKSLLREGGEFLLESLIIEGKEAEVLSPQGRYAKMPNVWFIPSVLTLEHWLSRVGFTNIRLVDITKTTSQEQRSTDWTGPQSLDDYLDPENKDFTIEGYPAPRRAIFIAQKP